MTTSVESLVRQIHDTSVQIVLAVTGGGSRSVAELFEVPGASRVMLEATVPYCEPAMIAWLGGRPDQFCSDPTARAMAVAGFNRARRYGADDDRAVGVASTASLATDRPKRGPHRLHMALQTVARTTAWSLELKKHVRSRAEEEHLAGRLLLNLVAEAAGVPTRLDLPLREGERLESSQAVAPQSWQDLVTGRVGAVGHGAAVEDSALPQAVLSGAFNPMHVGHRGLVEVARDMLGVPVAVELSIFNVDKPPMDYLEIDRRLRQFPPEWEIWLSRAATFEEKSRLWPGATFVVGVDTLRRIAAPQYYPGGAESLDRVLAAIADRGCRFLVFGRDLGAGFLRLSEIELPERLRGICREVPPERFREDISSTAIRRSQAEG